MDTEVMVRCGLPEDMGALKVRERRMPLAGGCELGGYPQLGFNMRMDISAETAHRGPFMLS